MSIVLQQGLQEIRVTNYTLWRPLLFRRVPEGHTCLGFISSVSLLQLDNSTERIDTVALATSLSTIAIYLAVPATRYLDGKYSHRVSTDGMVTNY